MASSSTTPQVYGVCAAPIKHLLLQWHRELAKATKRMRRYKDLPYWYNERANVGYVAQAASKLGYVVLEEYTVERGKRGRGRKVGSGRADLWIGDDSGDEYDIEFKQHWTSIRSNNKAFAKKIKENLNEAQEQLRSIIGMKDRLTGKVAMVFVSPWITKGYRGRWKELLGNFLDRVTRPRDYGAEFSTVFAPPDDVQGENRIASDYNLYPAIAIFGRMVR